MVISLITQTIQHYAMMAEDLMYRGMLGTMATENQCLWSLYPSKYVDYKLENLLETITRFGRLTYCVQPELQAVPYVCVMQWSCDQCELSELS